MRNYSWDGDHMAAMAGRAVCYVALCIVVAGCAAARVSPAELQRIQRSTEEAVGTDARVRVRVPADLSASGRVVISAHVLSGESAADRSPFVRGQYGNHQALTQLVQERSVAILRALVRNGAVPDVGRVVVELNHGVRVGRAPEVAGSDEALLLYSVSVPTATLKDARWPGWNDRDIETRWHVERNIIPELIFR
jgi:hypothetical protein